MKTIDTGRTIELLAVVVGQSLTGHLVEFSGWHHGCRVEKRVLVKFKPITESTTPDNRDYGVGEIIRRAVYGLKGTKVLRRSGLTDYQIERSLSAGKMTFGDHS